MTPLELLVCAVLIAVSSYLSASEIALFSLSKFQLRSLKETFRTGHRKIKRLLSDPGGLLVTILVLNETVNIALSTTITGIISRSGHPAPRLIAGLPGWAVDTLFGIMITAPIVMFLCEITPKVIAAKINRLVAMLSVGPLSILYDLLKPLRLLIRWIVGLVSSQVGRRRRNGIHGDRGPRGPRGNEDLGAGKKGRLLRESDFLLMIEEGHKEGAIQQSELDLIKNVFELDDTTVEEMFLPLAQARTIPANTTLRDALALMRGHPYSRIPVTGRTRKEILGVFYTKDLLRAKLDPELLSVTVGTVMKRAYFVHPSLRVNSLFRKFKQQRTHMAIVQRESGEALGIVTMSDVINAIFEDIMPDVSDGELERQASTKGGVK